MTVSLLEILAAARAHAAPLAAESAGYLLLAVADHVVAAPRVVGADDVELMPDGAVRLRARRGVAVDVGVEQVLRQLLARTLEVSSSVGPALRRAARRTEDAGLPALVRELETALIPVNRSAAKRALSRLHRETDRAKSAGKLTRLLDAEPAKAVAAPVVAAAIATAPVVAPPVAPVVAPPVAPVVAPPVVRAEPAPELLALADFPEASPVALPVQEAAPLPLVEASPPRAPRKPAAAPVVELTLTPEPLLAVAEPAFTKPEPVVQRAKERGSRTPRLGTLVTLQTLPGEEGERTERAPAVALDDESELDLSIDVELELDPEVAEVTAPLPAAVAQPLVDPEPSRMPDVLTAMVELHTGVDADEAPTRIRDVVTELRTTPAPALLAPAAPAPAAPAAPIDADETPTRILDVVTELRASLTPAPAPAASLTPAPAPALTPAPAASLTPAPSLAPAPAPALALTPAPAPLLTPEPEHVEDAWLTSSSLVGVVSAPVLFHSELAAPEVHEALTWNPGPVAPAASAAPLPPALVIAEPLPEPSPYAPAVLPARTSDVSDLLDSFYVSSAAEERDLRSALKEMAGLELTPMPHPYVEEG